MCNNASYQLPWVRNDDNEFYRGDNSRIQQAPSPTGWSAIRLAAPMAAILFRTSSATIIDYRSTKQSVFTLIGSTLGYTSLILIVLLNIKRILHVVVELGVCVWCGCRKAHHNEPQADSAADTGATKAGNPPVDTIKTAPAAVASPDIVIHLPAVMHVPVVNGDPADEYHATHQVSSDTAPVATAFFGTVQAAAAGIAPLGAETAVPLSHAAHAAPTNSAAAHRNPGPTASVVTETEPTGWGIGGSVINLSSQRRLPRSDA